MANYLSATELRKGIVFLEGTEAWAVLDYKHIKVARGGATVRVKVKGINTGVIMEKTFNSDSKVVEADVSKRSAQYLYSDVDSVYFMDSEDYSQFTVPLRELEDSLGLLQEGQKVVTLYLGDKPVSIDLPKTVELRVVESPDAVAGDTATNASKKAKLETGLEIDVPLFIKQGDVLKINTDDKSYISRIN